MPDAARIAGASRLPAKWRGASVAIGNFDGVHRGHQSVLSAALDAARGAASPVLVLTFEPHPREVFSGEDVFRLTDPGEKAAVLGRIGFDAVVEQPFDRDFASLTAEAFIDEVLVAGLGASHVAVGDAFRFGSKRAGDAALLARRLPATIVPAERAGADAISSSRIREALTAGDAAMAAELLGRRWRVAAEVRHGRKVGRTIGYPTANMALPPSTGLAHGIYAVRFRREGGTLHDGVASFGRRPTFDDGAPLLETFLFDFDGDLYGERACVTLFERLRGEERFDGVEALVAQMDRDAAHARAVLAAARPLSDLDRAMNFA